MTCHYPDLGSASDWPCCMMGSCVKQWRIQGEGPGGLEPPIRPYACSRQDNTPLFNLLLVLMKRVLYFVTELNSKNIKKCNTLP